LCKSSIKKSNVCWRDIGDCDGTVAATKLRSRTKAIAVEGLVIIVTVLPSFPYEPNTVSAYADVIDVHFSHA
jgi:hypothetical protein